MAKKTYDVTDIFGAMAEERKGMKIDTSVEPKVEVVAEPVAEEPAVTVKEEPKVEVTVEEPKVEPQKEKEEQANKHESTKANKHESTKANKQKKTPNDYDYGLKRTHRYPEELWREFEIILKFKGEKQAPKLVEFVANYVEENIEIVEMWKKMMQEAKKDEKKDEKGDKE